MGLGQYPVALPRVPSESPEQHRLRCESVDLRSRIESAPGGSRQRRELEARLRLVEVRRDVLAGDVAAWRAWIVEPPATTYAGRREAARVQRWRDATPQQRARWRKASTARAAAFVEQKRLAELAAAVAAKLAASREWQRAYRARPEVRERHREWERQRRAEGRARPHPHRPRNDEQRARDRAYHQRPDVKERRRQRAWSPERRAQRAQRRAAERAARVAGSPPAHSPASPGVAPARTPMPQRP